MKKIISIPFIFFFLSCKDTGNKKHTSLPTEKKAQVTCDCPEELIYQTNNPSQVQIDTLAPDTITVVNTIWKDSSYIYEYSDGTKEERFTYKDTTYEERRYKIGKEWLYYKEGKVGGVGRIRIGTKILPGKSFKTFMGDILWEGGVPMNPNFDGYIVQAGKKKYIMLTAGVFGSSGVSSRYTEVCLIKWDKTFSKRYFAEFFHFDFSDIVNLENTERLFIIEKNNPYGARQFVELE